MAIIKGTKTDLKSGTIGDLTFRIQDGRTIVSQRITTNSSNTPKQAATRRAFGEMARLAKNLDELNRIGFGRVKYGTSRNQFIRSNKELSNYYRTADWLSDDMPAVYKLCMVLEDPMFLGQVITSEGALNIQSSFCLQTDNTIAGELVLARDFLEGDKVVIGLGLAFQGRNWFHNCFLNYSKVLSGSDIKGLTNPFIYRFDNDVFPLVNVGRMIPRGMELAGVIATAIVVGRDDKSMGRFSRVLEGVRII